jgi:hypothetical protein
MHEFATDLMAVYLGFGLFAANQAFNFRQQRRPARTPSRALVASHFSASLARQRMLMCPLLVCRSIFLSRRQRTPSRDRVGCGWAWGMWFGSRSHKSPHRRFLIEGSTAHDSDNFAGMGIDATRRSNSMRPFLAGITLRRIVHRSLSVFSQRPTNSYGHQRQNWFSV